MNTLLDTSNKKEDNIEEVSKEEVSVKACDEQLTNVTRIQATSRMSVKIRDNFYTVEYLEERSLPKNVGKTELGKAKAQLFNSVNATIDAQIEEIVEGFKK